MFKSPNDTDTPIPVRETGHYWAKLTETCYPEVIYWTGRTWQRIGTTHSFNDDSFYEIYDKIKKGEIL